MRQVKKKTISSFAIDYSNIAWPGACSMERQVYARAFSHNAEIFPVRSEIFRKDRVYHGRRWQKCSRDSMPICVYLSRWTNHCKRLSLSAVLSTSAFHLATFDLQYGDSAFWIIHFVPTRKWDLAQFSHGSWRCVGNPTLEMKREFDYRGGRLST